MDTRFVATQEALVQENVISWKYSVAIQVARHTNSG